MLDADPVAVGWSDQCWTLARIAEVVHRRFRVEYILAGLDLLLHRIGWSVQIPSRKATERDEAKIAAWKDEQWPVIKGECFGRESGFDYRSTVRWEMHSRWATALVLWSCLTFPANAPGWRGGPQPQDERSLQNGRQSTRPVASGVARQAHGEETGNSAICLVRPVRGPHSFVQQPLARDGRSWRFPCHSRPASSAKR